ncbi:GAF domain-containing protein [Mariprofundus sp. EBB-1]|uniref:GAF domain-containing SpoIIE family protein phosphatase n=1 Tax=Mariprofundus sp. EBB-1 TaxID=2650971 RepID=UPI000EF2873C|nr:GAF domain-containing SpoIIE family protein phosphatase [Mariprofundus sp. EBB-1]RLL55552.1 GAF domain-containing protein [Mariprofundus sp. EBB-1]
MPRINKLDSIRILNKCQKRNKHLLKALEVNQLISSELQLGPLLKLIMEVTQKVMESEACTLFLLDAETGDLVFNVALGESSERLRELYRVPKGTGIAGWSAEHVQAVLQNNVFSDPRFNSNYDKETGFCTRNMVCVPVCYGEECIGVCQVINRIGGDFSEEDLNLLDALSKMVAVAIENARIHQCLLEKSLLERDLELAKQLQQSFLPASPPNVEGYDCAFFSRSAFEVGGDLYDAFPLPDGRVAYFLGDVSGKGVAAALIMSRVLKDLRYEGMAGGNACDILNRFNSKFCETVSKGMFVTLTLLILEPASGRMEIANAGHLPPVYLQGGKPRFGLEASGPPIGIIDIAAYSYDSIQLQHGETVLMYTDGITEAKSPQGELLGEDGMMALLNKAPQGAGNCIDFLYKSVNRFANGIRQSDDITLLALHRE